MKALVWSLFISIIFGTLIKKDVVIGENELCRKKEDSKCVLCAESILQDGRCIKPSQFIKFCLEYIEVEESIKCSRCVFNYIPSINTEDCHKINDNIAISNGYGGIIACKEGYEFINNECLKKPKRDEDEFCLVGTEQHCYLCRDDYALFEHTCFKSLNKFCYNINSGHIGKAYDLNHDPQHPITNIKERDFNRIKKEYERDLLEHNLKRNQNEFDNHVQNLHNFENEQN